MSTEKALTSSASEVEEFDGRIPGEVLGWSALTRKVGQQGMNGDDVWNSPEETPGEVFGDVG